MPAPAAKLVDNPDHLLDLTDLVFIDPVGTGYSRTVGDAGYRYWGVTEHRALIATFIDRYLTTAGRRASPKISPVRATAASVQRACPRSWPTTTTLPSRACS